jgi:Nuclear cap-binding protein subunit 3
MEGTMRYKARTRTEMLKWKRVWIPTLSQLGIISCYFNLDLSYRPNALLFHGPPISHLPTARLFAYATHFDAKPLGLEWIDDNTAVFVFGSKLAARTAQRNLQKSAAEEPDAESFVTAKPIPITLWPPEHRINATLGKGEGLKGDMRMRWAKADDVKKKGAKNESDFYKKYGSTAGKEVGGVRAQGPPKRRRMEGGEDDVLSQVQQLDDDLDAFLAEEDDAEPEAPPSPPSKMYSDYISTDGRTLLERTSLIRAHPGDLASRLTVPLPRRARERGRARQKQQEPALDVYPSSRGNRTKSREVLSDNRGRGRRGERPKKSQKDLDDELEAFLNEKD